MSVLGRASGCICHRFGPCFIVAWRGVAWRGVAWRGVAWRGVAWRGVAWRGVAWRGVAWRGVACSVYSVRPLLDLSNVHNCFLLKFDDQYYM